MKTLGNWILLAAALATPIGCTTCNHKACDVCLAPLGLEDDYGRAERNRVHIFIINGDDPFRSDRLCALTRELNCAGFSQVNSGGLLFISKFESRIKSIHCDDPDARFILIGQGFGVAAADGLAARLTTAGVPIECVVALATSTTFANAASHDVRRVCIGAGEAVGVALKPSDATYQVDGAPLESDPSRTAGLVLTIVREACTGVPPRQVEATAMLPLLDDPAPLPRAKAVLTPELKEPVKGILMSQPKK
jgi:hypothetical protein